MVNSFMCPFYKFILRQSQTNEGAYVCQRLTIPLFDFAAQVQNSVEGRLKIKLADEIKRVGWTQKCSLWSN